MVGVRFTDERPTRRSNQPRTSISENIMKLINEALGPKGQNN